MRLKSYAAGRWVEGTGRPTVLANAVTGEPVAEIDSTGLDFAGMLDHARRVGGPALRRLTFHQRALKLKALAAYLMDAQGGVLRAVERHRRHPHRLADRHRRRHRHAVRLRQQGPARAAQRHVLSRRRRRAAVARRQLRRPAHLRPAARRGGAHQRLQLPGAGACSRSWRRRCSPGCRPSSSRRRQTGLSGRAVFRRMVESGILPEGSLQLICGSVRRSARPPDRPGRRRLHGLGRHRRGCGAPGGPRQRACASRSEADSLNAAMLGPDAAPGTPEFDLFVREVVARDDRRRPGRSAPRSAARSCRAALRRRRRSTALRDRLAQGRWSAIRAIEGVRMGPLASLGAARRGARQRRASSRPRREIVVGRPRPVRGRRRRSGAKARSSRRSLLRCDDAERARESTRSRPSARSAR